MIRESGDLRQYVLTSFYIEVDRTVHSSPSHKSPTKRGNQWVVIQNRVRFRVIFKRMSYYLGCSKVDPNLENYPSVKPCKALVTPYANSSPPHERVRSS